MAVELVRSQATQDDGLAEIVMLKYPGLMCLMCLLIACFSCKKADVTAPDLPSPPAKKQFVFPCAVGNTWIYQYVGSTHPNALVRGVHTWKVIGADANGTWRMVDIRQDTMKYGSYSPTFSTDSVYFALSIRPDSIIVTFPEWLGWWTETVRIPVSFISTTDTLVVHHSKTYGLYYYETAIYCSQIGLVSFDGKIGGMTDRRESKLTLLNRYVQ